MESNRVCWAVWCGLWKDRVKQEAVKSAELWLLRWQITEKGQKSFVPFLPQTNSVRKVHRRKSCCDELSQNLTCGICIFHPTGKLNSDNFYILIFSWALPKKRLTKNGKVGIWQSNTENERKGQGRCDVKQQTCIITVDKILLVSDVDALVDAIVSSLSSLSHPTSTPTKISNETMKDWRSFPSVH